MSSRLLTLSCVVVAFTVAALRILGMAGFANDHFFYLTRAAQLQFGAWPVRDFVDPGFPLMIALSAAAQAVAGHTLWAEAALVAIAFGVAAAATLWVATRWTGLLWLGLWAVVVEVAILPRTYSYPKTLVYALAAAAFTRYASRPSSRSSVMLGAVVVVAFLFRHDHGIYIAPAALLLVAAIGEHGGRAAALRRVATWLLATMALLAPYLIYVQVNGGLPKYFATSLAYSQRDAQRTWLWLPRLAESPLWSADGLAIVAFYVFWTTPLVAALCLAWPRLRKARAERWPVVAMAMTATLMAPGFLRDPLTARIPDAVVPFVLLAAWLAARAWTAAAATRHGTWPVRGVVVAALVLVAAAAMKIGDFRQTLERAELLHQPPRPRLRWREVSNELRQPFAERQMPTDLAFALVPFYQYVQACTPLNARLLVTGYAPEIAYYAQRGFAGGHPSLYRGYFSSPEEQSETVARLQRELVLFVVQSPEGLAEFATSFPSVSRYVSQRFVPLADFQVEGADVPARVYVNRDLPPEPSYKATGWPCPLGER